MDKDGGDDMEDKKKKRERERERDQETRSPPTARCSFRQLFPLARPSALIFPINKMPLFDLVLP